MCIDVPRWIYMRWYRLLCFPCFVSHYHLSNIPQSTIHIHIRIQTYTCTGYKTISNHICHSPRCVFPSLLFIRRRFFVHLFLTLYFALGFKALHLFYHFCLFLFGRIILPTCRRTEKRDSLMAFLFIVIVRSYLFWTNNHLYLGNESAWCNALALCVCVFFLVWTQCLFKRSYLKIICKIHCFTFVYSQSQSICSIQLVFS